MHTLAILLFTIVFASPGFASDRGFAEKPGGDNKALIVSVGHGLSGLDFDVNNVKDMIANPAYAFRATELAEDNARVIDVTKALTQGAQDAKEGTFFFYYTGHGGTGSIWLQDQNMEVGQIRSAIEAGRKNMGPLSRLALIYDSCHAGSMMDKMRDLGFGFARRESDRNAMVADSLVNEFSAPSRDGAKYWNKLMVIASSRADENSLAGQNGSVFTVAMKKAFDEATKANLTVGNFISLSQTYTVGHHPVARLVPEGLSDEKMLP